MRGQDELITYQCRSTIAPTRRGENAMYSARLRAHCAASERFAAPARDVEEHLLEIGAAIARDEIGRRVVVNDLALLQHDDALAQPLDLAHVVRGEQHGGAARRRDSAPASERTQSAVSGSSDAVGSSSSSTSGSLISDLASATRVFWPADSLPVGRSSRSTRSSSSASACDARVDVGHAVEHAEHLEVLPHREPHRHVDIGALEIHPVQHAMALPRHVGAKHA